MSRSSYYGYYGCPVTCTLNPHSLQKSSKTNVSGLAAFGPPAQEDADPFPLRWGEVIPLHFLLPSLPDTKVAVGHTRIFFEGEGGEVVLCLCFFFLHGETPNRIYIHASYFQVHVQLYCVFSQLFWKVFIKAYWFNQNIS